MLIEILIVFLIAYVVFLVVDRMGLDGRTRQIVYIIIGAIIILSLLRLLPGGSLF